MKRLEILFADDQIPDEAIPDDKIKETLDKQHPEWGSGFINACVATRRTVRMLRNTGYEVTVANTFKEALALIKSKNFDVAIVDLGWFGDGDLPHSKKDFAGWDLSDELEQADKRLGRRTLQIIYSNRFMQDTSLSSQAAKGGKLPVCKFYDEATDQNLRAAVEFIAGGLSTSSFQEQFAQKAVSDLHDMTINSMREPLAQQKQWSQLSLVFAALSMLLVLIGVACAIFWNLQVGTLTSISSVITSAISALLFVQLKRSQELVKRSQDRVAQEYGKAIKRLYDTAVKATS